ncbi:MAG: hypothetical protein AABZ31_11935 [Bdellovibrionota bacterium]
MQTIKLSMITLLTTVVMMLPNAWAIELNGEAVKLLLESCASKTGTAKDNCEREVRAGIGGGGAAALKDGCDDSLDAFKKASEQFGKACSSLKMGIGEKCEQAFATCNSMSDDFEEDDDDGESKAGKEVDVDKYSDCPIPAIKDAKLAKEQIKELKDEIKELEDKVDQAKEKTQEAQKDIETAESERLEANNEREAQYEKENKAMGLEQDEKSEAAQKKIDAFEKDMRDLEQAKNDQDVQYTLDLAKVESMCEDIAEKELGAKIEGEAKAAQANNLKKRNLQAQLTLKSNGRTEENEAFRKRAIARCRANDARWKKPIELLNLNYKNNRVKLENAMKEVLLQKNKVYQELVSTLPQKKQQEAQELLTRYQKDTATIKAKFDTKIGQCGNMQAMQGAQPNQTESPNGCTGLKAVFAKAAAHQANQEAKLKDKKSDLEYYTKLLRVASSYVKDPDATDMVDLREAGSAYLLALDPVISLCSSTTKVSSKALSDYQKSQSNLGGTPTLIQLNADDLSGASATGASGSNGSSSPTTTTSGGTTTGSGK